MKKKYNTSSKKKVMEENEVKTQPEAEKTEQADAAQATGNQEEKAEQEATAEAPSEPAETVQDAVETLQSQLAAWNDRYLRLSAEFDNYRKRTMREKADLLQSAGGEVLKDLLPVVDDFERGLKAAATTDDMASLREGMQLVYQKMTDFLKRNGVSEMGAVGEVFDTDRHEALTKIPAPDASLQGKVVDVIVKGYSLRDKVLRFAKVVVGE